MTPSPKQPSAKDKADSEFTEHLITRILVSYPDGKMPVDSILVVFGMTMAAALSSYTRAERKRAAKALSDMILDPPPILQMPLETRTQH